MKKIIQDLLAIFDMRLVRASRYKILNLSDKEISPISVPYYVNSQPALVELDCNVGRTNRWFDLSRNSFDPHYYALKKGINEGLSGDAFIERVSKILEINKDMSVSKNAAEQFGLGDFETKLNDYPFWAEVLPWHICTINEVVKKTPFDVKKSRSMHNLIIESNDPDEIMRIDREYSIYSHAEQYEKLLYSIKQKGLLQSEKYGLIHAEILIKDGEYRWKPGVDGNHRTILSAAMGIKKIPLIVDKIIRYEDLEYWPNVVNSTFSKKEAEIIFNRIFDASPPEFYSQWISHCAQSIKKNN
jgi:hypothetical protein